MNKKLLFMLLFIAMFSILVSSITLAAPVQTANWDFTTFTGGTHFLDSVAGYSLESNGGINLTKTYPTYNVSGDGSPSSAFGSDELGKII